MVLGRKGEIFGARLLEQIHPGVGIETRGVEELVKDVVHLPKLLIGPGQRPRCVAANETVKAPVNSYAELAVLEGLNGSLRSVLVARINLGQVSPLQSAAVQGLGQFLKARLSLRSGREILLRRLGRRHGCASLQPANQRTCGQGTGEKLPSFHRRITPNFCKIRVG